MPDKSSTTPDQAERHRNRESLTVVVQRIRVPVAEWPYRHRSEQNAPGCTTYVTGLPVTALEPAPEAPDPVAPLAEGMTGLPGFTTRGQPHAFNSPASHARSLASMRSCQRHFTA